MDKSSLPNKLVLNSNRRGSDSAVVVPPPSAPTNLPKRRDSDVASGRSMQKPVPLPRTVHCVDLDSKPDPPERSVSLGFVNPIYCHVGNLNKPTENEPSRSSASYEEVKDDFAQSDNLYSSVGSVPRPLLRNSSQLLTDLKFQSPFHDAHASWGSGPQNWESFDLDPPSYPPPLLADSNFIEPFPDYDAFQDLVPIIPSRPQSSISTLSSNSSSGDNLSFEIRPELPLKKAGSKSDLIRLSPPPGAPVRRAPSIPEGADGQKVIPPKPPRKSKSVEAKAHLQAVFPHADYVYITGSHFSKQVNFEEFDYGGKPYMVDPEMSSFGSNEGLCRIQALLTLIAKPL